jgi:hypothetical protein
MSEVVRDYRTGKLVSSHDWGMRASGFLPSRHEEWADVQEYDPKNQPRAFIFRWTRRLGLRPVVLLVPRSLRRLLHVRVHFLR